MSNSIKKFTEHVEDILKIIGNDPIFGIENQSKIVITDEVLDKLTIWCFYSSLKDCLLSNGVDEKKRLSLISLNLFQKAYYVHH